MEPYKVIAKTEDGPKEMFFSETASNVDEYLDTIKKFIKNAPHLDATVQVLDPNGEVKYTGLVSDYPGG